MKKLIETSLLLFLVPLIVGTLTAQTQSGHDSTVLHVTYYHGAIRCQTCLMIEKYTDMTMRSAFAKELRDSSVVWTVKDYETDNDTAAVDKYGLENQALIISIRANGIETKWKLLPKIWDYAGDFEKFRKYVVQEVKRFEH